jgi:hypothetical protein
MEQPKQPDLRDPYTEVASRRQHGNTIQRIYDEVGPALGISRSEIGRLARKWKLEEADRRSSMQLVDWGRLTDVEWTGLPAGVPVGAVPFLLGIAGLQWGGSNLTVAEARFCWKMQQAASGLPPEHALALLRIFRHRFPLELRNEAVDYSDVWAYLARHRWGGADEDLRYLFGVVNAMWPPLYEDPPNRRTPDLTHRLRLAHSNLYNFIYHELDPLDPRWARLWLIQGVDGCLERIAPLLESLPQCPWDPRPAMFQVSDRRERAANVERLDQNIQRGWPPEIWGSSPTEGVNPDAETLLHKWQEHRKES